MYTIPYQVLGSHFHYDEKNALPVYAKCISSTRFQFEFDDDDSFVSARKLEKVFADVLREYDHAVIIDMRNGQIAAYNELGHDACFFVRSYPKDFGDHYFEGFDRVDYDAVHSIFEEE